MQIGLALAVVDSFAIAVTDFNASIAGTEVVAGTIHGDREAIGITQDTHFNGFVNDTPCKEFLKDFFRSFFPKFTPLCE
jgi:hypothetical protein